MCAQVRDRGQFAMAKELETEIARGTTHGRHALKTKRPSQQSDIMEPVILSSARKHRIADIDMHHAFRNSIRLEIIDDCTMHIGPDRNGNLLEIGCVTDLGTIFIIHAMRARDKYLR